MMTKSYGTTQTKVFGCTMGACVLATVAFGGAIPFESGRFLSANHDVYSGTFSQSLRIEEISLGDSSFSASKSELIIASSIRLSIDRNRDGIYELLSDEELRSGRASVGFALGRGLGDVEISTANDIATAFDLAKMFYTDGTSPVRVDLLLTVPIFDNNASSDRAPEALLISSFMRSRVSIQAIIAGNVDDPVLGASSFGAAASDFAMSETGVTMLMDRFSHPQRVSIIGADLSDDLGVREGITAIGYRLEIGAGEEAIFNLMGSGQIEQLALGLNESISETEIASRTSAGGLGGFEFDGGSSSGGAGGGRTRGRAGRIPLPSNLRQQGPRGFRASGSGSSGSQFDLQRFLRFLRKLQKDDEKKDIKKKKKKKDPKTDDKKKKNDDDDDSGGSDDTPKREPPHRDDGDDTFTPGDGTFTGDIGGTGNPLRTRRTPGLDPFVPVTDDLVFGGFPFEHDNQQVGRVLDVHSTSVPSPSGLAVVCAGLFFRRSRRRRNQ